MDYDDDDDDDDTHYCDLVAGGSGQARLYPVRFRLQVQVSRRTACYPGRD